MNYEIIDNRIKDIMKKMEMIALENPECDYGEFPPKWDKPLSEKQVLQLENNNNIKLPDDYRRFITTVARAGTQPFYGLCSPLKQIQDREIEGINLAMPFPCKIDTPINIATLSDEEYENIHKADENGHSDIDSGYIVLCDEGCAMYNILIVNSEDNETYGTTWFYDLANDFGIFPIINPKTNKPMNFLDWFEYYVDMMLKPLEEDYFSYGLLTGND